MEVYRGTGRLEKAGMVNRQGEEQAEAEAEAEVDEECGY
jgi:hypothetical protein